MFALLAQLASNSVHYVSIPAAVWRYCCVAVSFIFGVLCFWPCCDIVCFRSNLFFLLRTKVERPPGWFYYLTISSKNARDHPRILADPMKKDGLLTARRSGSNQLFPFSMPFAADSFFVLLIALQHVHQPDPHYFDCRRLPVYHHPSIRLLISDRTDPAFHLEGLPL